uniref:chorismate-binding protein n=1 Tax=Actinotalea sp. C106 TaxID=2908644 RepID=UPI002027FDB4
EPDARGLAAVLAAGNPAPWSGGVHVPSSSGLAPAWVVTASPELYLRLEDGVVTSGPIKGTAPTAAGLTDKDRAENVMIADMVRNDLQRVSHPGTVEVTSLLALEQHPGLVHLVTTVQGELLDGHGDWPALLDATYPPASVSGAPKSAALGVIADLEPVARGPYCGAVGWIDADEGRAELAVGIRTFWWTSEFGGVLRFGTGAGITWGSDPAGEWAETELKARRLVDLASRGGARSG